MDYATFKTYIATFLWKQNDTDLVNNLDSLIVMANAELARLLDINRRNVTLVIAPTVEDYVLPADFRHVISLNGANDQNRLVFKQSTASDVLAIRQSTQSQYVSPVYAVTQDGDDKVLMLAGPFATTTGSLTLMYRAGIPNFAVTNTSWLADDYLDLYVYTVLSHTAPFLREDERVAMWQQMKAAAITSAIDEDRHNITFGGSPMRMRPHHAVPR